MQTESQTGAPFFVLCVLRSTRATKFSGREGGLLTSCVRDVLFFSQPCYWQPPSNAESDLPLTRVPCYMGKSYLCSVYDRGSGSVSFFVALLLQRPFKFSAPAESPGILDQTRPRSFRVSY